jgi:RNA polymerase sigma factor (sigma-70 family)
VTTNQYKPSLMKDHDAQPPPKNFMSERDLFRQLHANVYPDLLRFVERRVPQTEAEDVVSATFATVWRRIEDLPTDARPWIFGIARHEISNHKRGSLRRRDLDIALTAGWRGEESYMSSDDVDTWLDLVAAWQFLSPRERETIALVAFDGLTAEQAAAVVGVRRSTFAMRLTRARERLRRGIENPSTHAPTRYARAEGKKDSK